MNDFYYFLTAIIFWFGLMLCWDDLRDIFRRPQ